MEKERQGKLKFINFAGVPRYPTHAMLVRKEKFKNKKFLCLGISSLQQAYLLKIFWLQ
jgi:hypothetical protein